MLQIGGTTTPPSQPIPAQVASVPTVSDITEKTEADKKGDEDSITEEIAELRTPEASKKITEWVRTLLFCISYLAVLCIIILAVLFC